jgi:hypothetical protein
MCASSKLHPRHVVSLALMLQSTAPTSEAALKSASVASTLRSDALSRRAPLKDACHLSGNAHRHACVRQGPPVGCAAGDRPACLPARQDSRLHSRHAQPQTCWR